MTLQTIKQIVDHRLSMYQAAKEEYRQAKESASRATQELENLRKAQAIAQAVAAEVQSIAHKRIAEVVSRSLEVVFDEPYKFKILFETKRGKTEARLVFERDGLELDPLSAAGGGVVDVAAFALRLSCLLLTRPPLRRMLVLDEPFRFVSACYRPRVRDLLERLSQELGVQFVIVTHLDEFRIGTVVEL